MLQLGDSFEDSEDIGWANNNDEMTVEEDSGDDEDEEAHPLFSKYFRTAAQRYIHISCFVTVFIE